MARTTVLGIGNLLLQDDGVGIHAVRRLGETYGERDDLTFLDGGTLSFDLASIIEPDTSLIVIDAAELGSTPGDVASFEGPAMDAFLGAKRRRSVHEVGLLDLMGIAALEDRLPIRRALIGIQPESVAWGDAPTEAVGRAIPVACARARALIEAWRQ